MKAAIRNLSEENFGDHPCFRFTRVNERTVAMTKKWLKKVYSKFGPCVKVAYVDNKPVAMVQYAPMDIFPHIDKPDAHKTVVVHCVYVAKKEYGRKGIGRKLLESLIQDLRRPHPYLNGGRFERIVAIAGKGRPGPAGPAEFFYKMGFTDVEQLGESDVLVQFQLHPEDQTQS